MVLATLRRIEQRQAVQHWTSKPAFWAKSFVKEASLMSRSALLGRRGQGGRSLQKNSRSTLRCSLAAGLGGRSLKNSLARRSALLGGGVREVGACLRLGLNPLVLDSWFHRDIPHMCILHDFCTQSCALKAYTRLASHKAMHSRLCTQG